MSIKSRTIDNLGIDASVRYAKDKELFEPKFIEESKLVSQKIEIPSSKPYVPTEFDQLFSSGRTAIWASFEPPPEFTYYKPLFTFQLIPSMGGYEKQEDNLDKLSALEDSLQKDRNKKRGKAKQDLSDKEGDNAEKERKTLLAFLECIQRLDKVLNMINTRRNQYQRG